MKYILASKSPRRRDILNKINLKFKIIPSNIDESQISTKLNPNRYCMELAELKAKDISKKYKNYTVIGADTIVVIDNIILNKPTDNIEAKKMLQLLSGSKHQVVTGVSIQNIVSNINYTFFDMSVVTFYDISDIEIEEYILQYNPLDKAGSYGIQDGSALFIKKIEGSYENIMGFPLSKFYQFFKNKIK